MLLGPIVGRPEQLEIVTLQVHVPAKRVKKEKDTELTLRYPIASEFDDIVHTYNILLPRAHAQRGKVIGSVVVVVVVVHIKIARSRNLGEFASPS